MSTTDSASRDAALRDAARKLLSTTIRDLRARLLTDLDQSLVGRFKLDLPVDQAGLSEAATVRRARLEAWIDEQARASGASRATELAAARRRLRDEVVVAAAATLLNRIVILRVMEATGQRPLAVVSGGWESEGYLAYRELAPALRGAAGDDETQGYGLLLALVFDELARDLPGLYGPQGMADLVPLPAGTLRHLVDVLDDDALASCWTDPLTLGWVYQYFNDPAREALDDKLNNRGKLEPHEIASKTQMFTERYMVDWLLQNSIGPLWLAMCAKQGWTPEVVADGSLATLGQRKAQWRAQRDAGQVDASALMPLHSPREHRWAFYMEQPIPPDAVEGAPDSIRALKLLDPAVGSGHFLVVALGLLLALGLEEARHRGVEGQPGWTPTDLVEHILEHVIHGVDLDPRAVQIAAAALWLEARRLAPDAQPRRLNLVSSQLRLANLPADDPALVALRRAVQDETGIAATLTDTLVEALKGADHLGSLLKIDHAVEQALGEHQAALSRAEPTQGGLFEGFEDAPRQPVSVDQARASIHGRLQVFLAAHTRGDDLGLRLRGQQLAAGVRFVEIVQEGRYDLVVANPPYQGTSKLVDSRYVKQHYPRGKADLYAAFLERGLQLCRAGGTSAMLTMRNWMFIKQYTDLRTWLLESYDLRALGDFAIGAFDEVPNDVLSVVVSVFRKAAPGRGDAAVESVAQQPTPPDDRSYDRERTKRKRAAVLAGVGVMGFEVGALAVVPGTPLLYWWDETRREPYRQGRLFEHIAPARFGLTTGDNTRFCRRDWEVHTTGFMESLWAHLVHGAKGEQWIDSGGWAITWKANGLEVKCKSEHDYGTMSKQIRNTEFYFTLGVAFSAIGNSFTVRAHRRPSVFSNVGLSLFPSDVVAALASLSTSRSATIVNELAPGLRFDVGDVNRLPLFPIESADQIFATLETAFSTHEAHREPSVEFEHPGPSPWRHAQDWAQAAVDRPEGAPLPPYTPVLDPEPPTDHLSYAVGVALGRFHPEGQGILDPRSVSQGGDDLSAALPHGILFLDGTLADPDHRDSLGHPAAAVLHHTWATHGPPGQSLRDWLRLKYFKLHKKTYDNTPIHWPLCSSDPDSPRAHSTFVAWLTIHRMDGDTLTNLLAFHLEPARERLRGERNDLATARSNTTGPDRATAEARFTQVQAWLRELDDMIATVIACSAHGPPPTDGACAARQIDAPYAPDLDDGVMINSAALWPLLDPQWRDPKQSWKKLANEEGVRGKDFDWAHLAMRYWPIRVDQKCQGDPSLGVAHGCFWRYHPARAWAWELRLQDEIGLQLEDRDFRIEEPPYQGGPPNSPTVTDDPGHQAHRAAYLATHPTEALAAIDKEARRRKKKADGPIPSLTILEPGLWTHHPAACWALEDALTEWQEAPFRLLAPDEPQARATFAAAHSDHVRARSQAEANMQAIGLFGGPPNGT